MEKKQLTVSLIPLSEIMIKPGVNPRTKLPLLDEMKNSIRAHGIQEPLKVYYDNEYEKYIVVKGHRRISASLLISEEDGISPTEIKIPCLKYGGIPENLSILRDHVVSNSGVPFTAIEKAEIIRRYINEGLEITQIAEEMGITYQQCWNLNFLNQAPKEIHDLIENNQISSTLVIELFKKEKSYDQMLDQIKAILLSGAAKITSKNYKEIKEDDSEEFEEETPVRNTANPIEKTDSKKLSLDQRVEVLISELNLKYNDKTPEINSKIDFFKDIITELKEGTEISVIVNSIFQ
jgi:ParB-like chromosome segregation protein Spo0J